MYIEIVMPLCDRLSRLAVKLKRAKPGDLAASGI